MKTFIIVSNLVMFFACAGEVRLNNDPSTKLLSADKKYSAIINGEYKDIISIFLEDSHVMVSSADTSPLAVFYGEWLKNSHVLFKGAFRA